MGESRWRTQFARLATRISPSCLPATSSPLLAESGGSTPKLTRTQRSSHAVSAIRLIRPHVVAKAMADYAMGLATEDGYSGYDPVIIDDVKKALVDVMYKGTSVTTGEIFVSDGSKCDLARFQTLFKGAGCKVAIPDPAYPAYVDNSVISGMTEEYEEGPGGTAGGYKGITYLKCRKENNFFPDISQAKDCDIIYFCNPNNPTGACATRTQLEELVKLCIDNKILLIYDAAYAYYIRDEDKPKTIFEIPGAETIAIETNSFSKLAGFTGVRLGWTVIPSAITYPDGSLVKNDFNRVFGTHFNGSSNVALAGGLATLQNMDEVQKVLDFYKENTNLILATLAECGFQEDQIVGGKNSPYIFVEFPGKGSWEVFDKILASTQVITTPGWALVRPAKATFVSRLMVRGKTSRRHASASRQLDSSQTWICLSECCKF